MTCPNGGFDLHRAADGRALLEPAFAIAGGFGFDWHEPESARCTRVTETEAQRLSACKFHESGAFGLPIAYHACMTRKGGEFLVFKTAALCREAIETMEANAP